MRGSEVPKHMLASFFSGGGGKGNNDPDEANAENFEDWRQSNWERRGSERNALVLPCFTRSLFEIETVISENDEGALCPIIQPEKSLNTRNSEEMYNLSPDLLENNPDKRSAQFVKFRARVMLNEEIHAK